MNLQFKKLKLHNFGPYIDAQIMLENKGFCLVTGQNNYKKDNALSNGSGKSFIWSGICYALTGETIGGFHTNLMNINATDNKMSVMLDFYVGADHYIIERGQVASKYLFITKNDEDCSGKTFTESTNKLSELLPDLSRELIATSIILGQGMPLKFSSFSPSGRKELLEKLTKSDYMIEDIKARVGERNEYLTKLQRSYEDTLLVNTTKLNSLKTDLEKLQADYKNAVKPNFDEAIATSKALINDIQKDIDNTNISIENIEKNNTSINNKLVENITNKATDSADETNAFNEATKELTSQKASLNTTIVNLTKEITKLKNITDICPVCGQKLKGVEKPHTEEHEKELLKAQTTLNDVQTKLTSLTTQHLANQKSINEAYDSTIKDLNTQITANTNNINKLKTDLNDFTHYQDIEKTKLAKLIYDKENWDKYFIDLEKKIDLNKTAQIEIEKLISLTKEAQLDTTTRLATIKKIDTLIKRDFRGYLLSNIINYLNKKAKDYSNIVFGTKELELFIDGNALNITYCNKIMDNLSGGEKTRVDLIIQLALRSMLKTYLNFNSNILVLDEITDFLDKQSCKAVMSLLEAELNTVESVFIISHHAAELDLSIDSDLKVIKDADGNSEVY